MVTQKPAANNNLQWDAPRRQVVPIVQPLAWPGSRNKGVLLLQKTHQKARGRNSSRIGKYILLREQRSGTLWMIQQLVVTQKMWWYTWLNLVKEQKKVKRIWSPLVRKKKNNKRRIQIKW